MDKLIVRWSLLGVLVFVLIGIWQFLSFQLKPVDDFYQPQGYIRKVDTLIREGKIYVERERTTNGFRNVLKVGKLAPEESVFLEQSWLRDDIQAFNDGNADVFLIDRGRLSGINVYRHNVESPLAGDWSWWGRIYSQSSEGYAYLWNSRRTLKLYRPPPEERVSAKLGQSEFREVVYGRGQLFQTGIGISLKGRSNNRIADVYAMGDSVVLKSYGNNACFIDGHLVAKGQEQRLEEGDLVQIYFDDDEREEFLFHNFSEKPLSFVNVLNGRVNRTNLDTSFHFIEDLSAGVETALRKTKKQKMANFDLHLALDEDLAGLAQNSLQNFTRALSKGPVRASCTILDARNGQVLATASTTKKPEDVNENFRLHPVGSSTKIFLAAAAAQNYPDLLNLEIDPHPPGEEKNLLGYDLREGYKLRAHAPMPGEPGRTNFTNYLAKSCNRYHAILMTLSLAKDSAIASNQTDLSDGIAFSTDPVETGNGYAYLNGREIVNRPDLRYFIGNARNGSLECTNLENSELALNLERLFHVKRKFYEGSGDYFSPEPWNILFARLGLQERPDLYPAFYKIMPQTVNMGFNLNIDFRLDFISIIFGGATNRWNNIHLAEATSRLVTNTKVDAKFVAGILDDRQELSEQTNAVPLGITEQVQENILRGMEAVCAPGGTAGDLYPLLQELKNSAIPRASIEFYGKTGTPFRREIRKGDTELYSSVFLLTAVLRDRETLKLRDALTFAVYIEDQGEHKAVDFTKQILKRILTTRRWIQTND